MRCMYAAPDDPQVQCVREATVRFSAEARLPRPVMNGGSHMTTHMTSYAYVCERHEGVGPAIARRRATAWGDVEGVEDAPDWTKRWAELTQTHLDNRANESVTQKKVM